MPLRRAVANAANALIGEHRELIARLIWRRTRFENWLQLCILNTLQHQLPEMDIERSYPNSHERCDFWMPQDSSDQWLELKLCVTNYCSSFADTRKSNPITNQIGDVIKDIEKLSHVDSLGERTVLVIVYPLPKDYQTHSFWQSHLLRLSEAALVAEEVFAVDLERQGVTCKLVGYELRV